MEKSNAGDTKTIQVNGKFVKHEDVGKMPDSFLQLFIIEDADVKKAIGGRKVTGVVIIGNSVNVVTK